MLELKRRGYQVFTGKWDEREIDFVAEKYETKIYVQLTYQMEGQSSIDRELHLYRNQGQPSPSTWYQWMNFGAITYKR